MKDQILNLHSRMNFGKHRGETIGQVVDENPSYIKWMIENIDNIAFSEDVVSELDLSDDLVEINFDIRFPSNQHKRMRRRAVEARQSTLDLVLGLLGAVSRSDIDSTPGGERS